MNICIYMSPYIKICMYCVSIYVWYIYKCLKALHYSYESTSHNTHTFKRTMQTVQDQFNFHLI